MGDRRSRGSGRADQNSDIGPLSLKEGGNSKGRIGLRANLTSAQLPLPLLGVGGGVNFIRSSVSSARIKRRIVLWVVGFESNSWP